MRDAITTSDARVFVKGYKELLSAEEEAALFGAWWATNPTCFQALIDESNEDVARFEGPQDDEFITRIILAYTPVIRRAIKELANYRMDEEELLSEGLIAMAEAARRYNPTKEIRFAAYAKVCVKGTMHGYIMRNYFMVQFCTNHSKKRLFYSLRRRIAIELQEKSVFQMTDAVAQELAEDHNLEASDVWLMYQMFQKPYDSLDQPVFTMREDQEPNLLGDTIEDEETGTEETVFAINEIEFHKSLVGRAMQCLTHRERTVFVAQVLSDKENQRTLDDLGLEFDVSKERIRQVRIEAMRKVTAELGRLRDTMGLSNQDIFSD